jgi:hypothetical protein
MQGTTIQLTATIDTFRDSCYVCLGDSATACTQDRAEKLYGALTDEGQTMEELALKADISRQDVSRGFVTLGSRARREGRGVKGEPYKYSRNAIHPTPDSKEKEVDEWNIPAPGYSSSVEDLIAELGELGLGPITE